MQRVSSLRRYLDEVFQVVAIVGVALPRSPAAAAAANPTGSRAPPEQVRRAQLDALQAVHHLLSGEAEPAKEGRKAPFSGEIDRQDHRSFCP